MGRVLRVLERSQTSSSLSVCQASVEDSLQNAYSRRVFEDWAESEQRMNECIDHKRTETRRGLTPSQDDILIKEVNREGVNDIQLNVTQPKRVV